MKFTRAYKNTIDSYVQDADKPPIDSYAQDAAEYQSKADELQTLLEEHYWDEDSSAYFDFAFKNGKVAVAACCCQVLTLAHMHPP